MSPNDLTCGGLLPLLDQWENAPALHDDLSDEWLSRADLRLRAGHLAQELAATRKCLVFLRAANDIGSIVALLGAAAAGHAIALIDSNLDQEKYQALVDTYRPDFVLASADSLHPKDSVAIQRFDGRGTAISKGLLILLSTSGTTGGAKFVRLSADAVCTNANQIAASLAIKGGEDVGIAHLPVHYSYGLSVVTSHLIMGASVFLMNDAITSPTFWPKIENAGGTHFPGVPFHYTVLARFGLKQVVPACVRSFTQAGGGLDPRMQLKIHGEVADRGGRFYVMYGQTEASPRMTTLPSEKFLEKQGSVGIALPDACLEIKDDEGRMMPAGDVGNVHFYGPNVMDGYATGPDDLALDDLSKGHLDTGDLGKMDEDGYLFLTGRVKRFAKIAGLRLGLDELDAQIAPIAIAATVDKGDQILVFYEASEDVDLAATLKAYLKAMALDYKIPPMSFTPMPVDRLPRKDSGKLDFARLRELANV